MKISSYKFLPLMYQLAARMGTKTMGDEGFHEVLNNVSRSKNQNTIIDFFYITMYCIKQILTLLPGNGSTHFYMYSLTPHVSLCLIPHLWPLWLSDMG